MPISIQNDSAQKTAITLEGYGCMKANLSSEYFKEQGASAFITLERGDTLERPNEEINKLNDTIQFICDWLQDKLCGTHIIEFKSQFDKVIKPDLDGDDFHSAFLTLQNMVQESKRDDIFKINNGDFELTPEEMLQENAYVSYEIKISDNIKLTIQRSPTKVMKEEAILKIEQKKQEAIDLKKQQQFEFERNFQNSAIYKHFHKQATES